MLEGFTKHWGFYFVMAQDAPGIGVKDLHYVLETVVEYKGEWTSDLDILDLSQRGAAAQRNRLIATKLLRKVLAARILVFELFLRLAKEIEQPG